MGWGFVVRGSKPCHIQAVDPSGPAAAAGMKVCNTQTLIHIPSHAPWHTHILHCQLGVESTDLNNGEGRRDVGEEGRAAKGISEGGERGQGEERGQEKK